MFYSLCFCSLGKTMRLKLQVFNQETFSGSQRRWLYLTLWSAWLKSLCWTAETAGCSEDFSHRCSFTAQRAWGEMSIMYRCWFITDVPMSGQCCKEFLFHLPLHMLPIWIFTSWWHWSMQCILGLFHRLIHTQQKWVKMGNFETSGCTIRQYNVTENVWVMYPRDTLQYALLWWRNVMHQHYK